MNCLATELPISSISSDVTLPEALIRRVSALGAHFQPASTPLVRCERRDEIGELDGAGDNEGVEQSA